MLNSGVYFSVDIFQTLRLHDGDQKTQGLLRRDDRGHPRGQGRHAAIRGRLSEHGGQLQVRCHVTSRHVTSRHVTSRLQGTMYWGEGDR